MKRYRVLFNELKCFKAKMIRGAKTLSDKKKMLNTLIDYRINIFQQQHHRWQLEEWFK